MISDAEYFFHVSVGHLYIFYEKILFRCYDHFIIGLFFFLMLHCMCSLYILDISLLLDKPFENIFLQ